MNNVELKKQLLIGLFGIIVAIIGAAGLIIPAMLNQELSVLKVENSKLEGTISKLTEENSQLKGRISILEHGAEVSDDIKTNSTDTGTNLGEDPIVQNLDAILQKKAEYTYSDTQQIECDRVWIWIYEKAGYIYNSLQKSDDPVILEGKKLDSVIVYFLDYETDNVICTLLSSNGAVEYYPGNTRKFYCVVATSEYELYVSKPIQALGGDNSRAISILLDKIEDKYSPLFQVRLEGCDSSQSSQDCSLFSDAAVCFYCMDTYSEHGDSYYQVRTTDSGIVEHHWSKSYFSLNTRYVLNVSLKLIDVSSSEEMYPNTLPYKTIDGSIKDTNIINVFFEYDGSKTSIISLSN